MAAAASDALPLSFSSFGQVCAAAVLLGVLTSILRASSRLWYHPLSHVPGPRLAALSNAWLVWNEFFKSRNFTDILTSLHARYGPVVRYSPNCVHFSTPQAYWDTYSRTSRWDKDPHLYDAIGDTVSSFGLSTFKDAKVRRDIVTGFFSRRMVLAKQDLIVEQVNICVDLLVRHSQGDRYVDLTMALRSFAQDTMTQLCLGSSTDTIQAPDFQSAQIRAIGDNMSCFVFLKSFPLLRQLIYSTPLAAMMPGETELESLEDFVVSSVSEAFNDPEDLSKAPNGCLLRYLMDYESKASEKLNAKYVTEEMGAFVNGGGETVTFALITGFHHLLQQQELQRELLAELVGIWPSPQTPVPGLDELERLPLLTAFLKELLRLSYGPVTPLRRIVPPSGATIDGLHLPGGTSVGVSHVFVHNNRSVFQDPESFAPHRWLQGSSEEQSQLDKHLVAFGRGPRSCTGMSIAWAELYLASAILIRRLEMQPRSCHQGMPLTWRDCFLPHMTSPHIMAHCSLRSC